MSCRPGPQPRLISHVYVFVQGRAFISQCMSSNFVGFLDMDTDVFHLPLGTYLELMLLLQLKLMWRVYYLIYLSNFLELIEHFILSCIYCLIFLPSGFGHLTLWCLTLWRVNDQNKLFFSVRSLFNCCVFLREKNLFSPLCILEKARSYKSLFLC